MKLVWIKWFFRDWLSETTVTRTSLAARGLWREALDVMTDRHTYKLEGTRDQIAADLRCTVADLSSALPNLKASGIGDVTLGSNGYVTLKSRRLEREFLDRENSRKRVADHRLKHKCNGLGNAKVPLVSGSGSGSSESGNGGAGGKGFPVTVDDALAQCDRTAVPKEFVMTCYDLSSSRGGLDAKGVAIQDFPAYVRVCWKYEQDRKGREQNETHQRNNKPGNAKPDYTKGF